MLVSPGDSAMAWAAIGAFLATPRDRPQAGGRDDGAWPSMRLAFALVFAMLAVTVTAVALFPALFNPVFQQF
jgi:hypothetical protein